MPTGEPAPAEKQVDPIESPESPLALPSCAFMGTVARDGSGHGVVTETGARTAFGAIAMRLGERQPETSFQLGLQKYSMMLVHVTTVMAAGILVVNYPADVIAGSVAGAALAPLAVALRRRCRRERLRRRHRGLRLPRRAQVRLEVDRLAQPDLLGDLFSLGVHLVLTWIRPSSS